MLLHTYEERRSICTTKSKLLANESLACMYGLYITLSHVKDN